MKLQFSNFWVSPLVGLFRSGGAWLNWVWDTQAAWALCPEITTEAAAVCKGRRDVFCRTVLEEASWNGPFYS